jgi:hypothetical protein
MFKLQLYADMRVVVQKNGDWHEVRPQKFKDGKWENSGDPVMCRTDLADAKIDALTFSLRLIKNLKGR